MKIKQPGLIGQTMLLLSAALLLSACYSRADDNADVSTRQIIPVNTAVVGTATVDRIERSIGRVETFSLPEVAAEVDGRIMAILADVGDEIDAGDTLARIESEPFELALGAAQADEERLLIQAEHVERELGRLLPLREQSLVSESEIESLQSDLSAAQAELEAVRFNKQQAERNFRNTEIISPVAGRLDARFVSEGDYIAVGTSAFRVTPLSSYRVEISFPQALRNVLAIGQPVALHPTDDPEESVYGEVSRVRPSVTDGSRSLRVVVEFENQFDWQPGTTVAAEVAVDSRPDALQVPRISVVQRPAGAVVYLLNVEGSQVSERVVETGIQGGDWVEIVSGLAAGDRVVTDGASFLTNEAYVRDADTGNEPAFNNSNSRTDSSNAGGVSQ